MNRFCNGRFASLTNVINIIRFKMSTSIYKEEKTLSRKGIVPIALHLGLLPLIGSSN